MDELYKLFKNNFPYIVRNIDTAKSILNNSNNVIFEKRDNNNNLIGVVVINNNTIIFICVDKEYRNQGIGTKLLQKAEEHIKNNGYNNVVIGAGFDYLMPGVPVNKMVYVESLQPDNVYTSVTDNAYNFFKNKGYYHSWEDCNCFDMRLNLNNFNESEVLDTIDGITYSYATLDDLSDIVTCVNDAWDEFTKYYQNENLYNKNNNQRVLIAKDNGTVVGTLIISFGMEESDLGSVGCTAVKHSHRGRHIGVNLVKVGTKHLKQSGYKNAFLGYTYTGLDKMYGYSGYQICVYYFMAKKNL